MSDDLLTWLEQQGIRPRVVRGELKLVGEPERITPEVIEKVRQRKAELLSALATTDPVVGKGKSPRNRWPRAFREPTPLRSCCCGCQWFWLSSHGAIRCCACDPPVDLGLAEAWVLAREDTGHRIPPEILAMLCVKQLIQ